MSDWRDSPLTDAEIDTYADMDDENAGCNDYSGSRICRMAREIRRLREAGGR